MEYTDKIALHPNYSGMPDPRKKDGSVRWVVTGKSELGRERLNWWDQKRRELGLPKKGKWQSAVSRVNHPTRDKPCQICGKVLKIDYVYPNKNTIKQLNKEFNPTNPFLFMDLLRIDEVVDILSDNFDEGRVIEGLRNIFKIPSGTANSIQSCLDYILTEEKTKLSPGVMSNCPDRFDGFHTYNKCCRSKEDKGRHADNLRRYGEDRRAYEHWSDGDWKAAGWLMKLFGKAKKGVCLICGKEGKVTADHLGPISLGFSVGNPPRLRSACSSCNSSRNNRMTLDEIERIIQLERGGIEVASWHTKHVWDALKDLPASDKEAKLVSRLMRLNIHYIFTILGRISEANYRDFLKEKYLHPEYAFFTIEFIGFNPTTGDYDNLVKTPASRTEQKRNAARYERIAFESLEKYISKRNRNIPSKRFEEIEEIASRIVNLLDNNDNDGAYHLIDDALLTFAKWAKDEYLEKHEK